MKQEQIDYDKVVIAVEKTVLSSSFYWQSLSLIGCFVLSYFAFRLVRKFLFPRMIVSTLKKNADLNRFMVRYVTPLLYPLLAVLFMSLGLSVYSEFFKETILFATTLKLVALFSFLRFLRISSNNNFFANVAGILLMPALLLDIFDFLTPTIHYLDQYAIEIGSVRISVYVALKAFVVILIVMWFANLVGRKSKIYIDNNKTIKSSTKQILSKFIDITVYATIIIVVLKTFGVDMTTFAVVGGAVGVGIGFGLQKIASNFISGIILLFEKSVEIGDIVELDNGNIFGTIKHFSGRYTLIEGADGKEIMVPNEELIVNKVANWTYSNNRARIEIKLGVSYGSDLEKVKDIMIACAKENPRCLNYPDAECYMTEFADSDIKFVLYFWISDIAEGRAKPKSEVMVSIWTKFIEEGIEIPLPQHNIRIIKD
jgi:small-conductance mechanosensitive channel